MRSKKAPNGPHKSEELPGQVGASHLSMHVGSTSALHSQGSYTVRTCGAAPQEAKMPATAIEEQAR